MKFHLFGLDYTPTVRERSTCAFTHKILKLAQILKNLGHIVYFYGSDDSEIICNEHIIVQTKSERETYYGDYDWKSYFYPEPITQSQNLYNDRIILNLKKNVQPNDFLLCPLGVYHESIAMSFPNNISIEPGIGYIGIFSQFKIFESYAWMHYLYGKNNYDVGHWNDAVIPNYYDLNDYHFVNMVENNELLFIGRLIQNKGVDIAIQVSKQLNLKLTVVGQGSLYDLGYNDEDLTNVDHIGTIGPNERKYLFGKYKACFAPTYYIEPFGSVVVESQLCGTPIITTDWGAFSENVIHNKTGFRCRTYSEFLKAVENINIIKRQDCFDFASTNYDINTIALKYDEYFTRLYNCYYKGNSGWYTLY